MINPRELSVDAMRALARDRTEQSSIRTVAQEMGLGHTTLYNFLQGATPHPRVRRALAEWYVRQSAALPGAERPAEAYSAALAVLVDAMPPETRASAADELLSYLESLHRQGGGTTPGWITRLREESASPASPDDEG